MIIDIKDMPGYNPVVLNGIDSVSNKQVYSIRIGGREYPQCIRHKFMLKVSKEGVYRCGELSCSNGCFKLSIFKYIKLKIKNTMNKIIKQPLAIAIALYFCIISWGILIIKL